MGRFSKLETHTPGTPAPQVPSGADKQPEAAPEPLGPKYDYGYYTAEAEELFFQGEYQKALRLYSRAIQADRTQIGPWLGQVLCLLELKQYKEAMVWVKRALELFPEDPRVLSIQGAVMAHQGMVQRGLGCSDYAMSHGAQDPLTWVLRGEILSLAENKNAVFCFEKAMESCASDEWHIPAQIGLFLLRLRHWSPAAQYLKRAVAANPNSDFLWMSLGSAYERLGLGQSAHEAYSAAAHLNPQKPEICQALKRLGDMPLFVRLLKRVFH